MPLTVTLRLTSSDLGKLDRVFQVILDEKIDFELVDTRVLLPSLLCQQPGQQQFSDVTVNAVKKVITHRFSNRYFTRQQLVEQVKLLDGPSASTVTKLLPVFCSEGYLDKRGSNKNREYCLVEDPSKLQALLQHERQQLLEQSKEGF